MTTPSPQVRSSEQIRKAVAEAIEFREWMLDNDLYRDKYLLAVIRKVSQLIEREFKTASVSQWECLLRFGNYVAADDIDALELLCYELMEKEDE